MAETWLYRTPRYGVCMWKPLAICLLLEWENLERMIWRQGRGRDIDGVPKLSTSDGLNRLRSLAIKMR
jgi:hypothetical protein